MPQVTQTAAKSYSEAMVANMKDFDTRKVSARVFRANIPSCRYVFKEGKVAAFLSGKYTTNIAGEISELDAEVALGHPNITANAEEVLDVIEPLELLKKRHIEEYLASVAKSIAKSNDAGFSDQGKLNVANSTTISEGAAGSDSVNAPAPVISKINLKV